MGTMERSGRTRPLVVGHRGASAYAPENTLAAFRLAVEQGAQGIELDVHRSRDGALVICHDASVARTTDGQGTIAEQELAELQRYDAGYRFSPVGADEASFPYRGQGLRLPTLDEALAVIPPALLVNAELKAAGDEAARAALVDAFAGFIAGRPEQAARVLVSSFDHRIVDAVAARGLGVRTGYLFPEDADLARAVETVRRAGHAAVHPHLSSVTAEAGPAIAAARAAGLAVNVWTVDDPEQARRLAGLGVSAIITNRPDTLLAALGAERAS